MLAIGRQVEALIIASCNPDRNASFLSALRHEHTPTVLFDRYPKALHLPYVGGDDRLGARLATEHWCGADTEKLPIWQVTNPSVWDMIACSAIRR